MLANTGTRFRERGLTLVELMVGVTIGLVITAGASYMALAQINEHRRLTIETQLLQDLRAASTIIVTEIKRAGYRQWNELGVWSPKAPGMAASTAEFNPFAEIQVANVGAANGQTASSTFLYQYEYKPDEEFRRGETTYRQPSRTVHDRNRYGFKISNKTLMMMQGLNNWQPVTDPKSFEINDALSRFALVQQSIPLTDFCDQPCTGNGCPMQIIRVVNVTLVAESKLVPGLVRRVDLSERVGNDDHVGSCL